MCEVKSRILSILCLDDLRSPCSEHRLCFSSLSSFWVGFQEKSKAWPSDPIAVGVVVACCTLDQRSTYHVFVFVPHGWHIATFALCSWPCYTDLYCVCWWKIGGLYVSVLSGTFHFHMTMKSGIYWWLLRGIGQSIRNKTSKWFSMRWTQPMCPPKKKHNSSWGVRRAEPTLGWQMQQ